MILTKKSMHVLHHSCDMIDVLVPRCDFFNSIGGNEEHVES